MGAITIRRVPDDVHGQLREIASQAHVSVEAFVRSTLIAVVRAHHSSGINFEQLERDRAQHGLTTDGPAWGPDLDDPVLSRQVLGLC